MTKKTAVSEARREVRTYADLHRGADALLGMAQATERGRYFITMSALLLTAFEFEAYLNHLGNAVIPLLGPDREARRAGETHGALQATQRPG